MRLVFAMFVAILLSATAVAETGQPVAVRWWGQGMVSIETMWNLRVVIDPYKLDIGYDDPKVAADLVLVTHEHGDHNNVGLVAKGGGEEPFVARGLDENGKVRVIEYTLDRLPNAERASWEPSDVASTPPSGNAITVRSIAAWHDNNQGSERGATALFVVDVDGVRIVHCGDLGQHQLTDEQLESLNALAGGVDVLLLPVGGKYTIDGKQAMAIVEQVHPRLVVPIHYKTDVLKIPLATSEDFLKAASEGCAIAKPRGNTLAVAKEVASGEVATTVVPLAYRPWPMPDELAALLEKKEQASRASQAVFAKLSPTQLNWQPPNGTHTPRWNTEHMMGRELLFFSQIYHAVDPTIPVIDLNPKQMPPDYVAAHPDWTGAEEARQTERVTAFTRRFSYLLADLPLDKKAPDSFWTPRKLLLQMDRHYNEHTANVEKKFELEGWPTE